MLLSRVPVREYTTQLSPPSSTKPPVMGSTRVGSITPVCWGQPGPGIRAMRVVSTQSLTSATELPTSPVVNSTTAVSTATMSAVRRSRRARPRARACSRYSTRPAESGSSLSGRWPRWFFLIWLFSLS